MSGPISLSPSKDPSRRHATRLLTMIHELHKAGYQHIRFSSGWAPSGMSWRCSITHVGNMMPDGLRIASSRVMGAVAHYSTSAGDHYFQWSDAPGRSARELGTLFLERFPIIAQQGLGRDWSYAGWLTEMLGRAERDEASGFPIFFADFPLELHAADLPPPIASALQTPEAVAAQTSSADTGSADRR